MPKVPITDTLMSALYAFQEAVDQQVPDPSVKSIGSFINQAASLTQDVIDMKIPLANMATSGGLSMSNAVSTRHWLSSLFPPELQPFADTIKEAHSFIEQGVQKIEDYVEDVSVKSTVWLTAAKATLQVLKRYIDNGLQFNGISDSIKAAQRMVSASRFCVPLLSKKKEIMASNLKTVSSSLIDGPHGTKRFMKMLKSPLSASAVSISSLSITSKTWEATLTEISNGWEKFVMQSGVKLYGLISTQYTNACPTKNPNSVVGKRSACKEEGDLDFFDMVLRIGENDAKRDMRKFLEDNGVASNTFKWTSYKNKLASILGDFEGIPKSIADSDLASPASLKQLQDVFKNQQLFQSCVRQLSAMIDAACYRTSTPDESKVSALTC
ncbi:uncharacterized protein [Watersipora subatra]|uniref:uncharacterized protein n=1 Tax=Watersipora subatra TaxID=2589382 RepID=UPI00355B426A